MTTITKFTKEQLIEKAKENVEFFRERLDLLPQSQPMALSLRLAEIALASLTAEPVAYADPQSFDNFKSMGGKNAACTKEWMWRDSCDGLIPVFAAPPAPGVPEEMLSAMEEVLRISERDHEAWHKARNGIASYRAAMLQGAGGKPELTVWYGATPETNGKTNWTAMLHRKGQYPLEGITIDCSEYPDRVRYEADRMRHLIGELADEPDILAYDADAHSGYVEPVSNRDELSSPAIPDGYVLVPKRLTAENFAKAALSGEFSETKFINCPECFGDDECETCDGSGRIEISVPVSWTNIKAIWAKGVEHFAAAPQQEVNDG